MVNRVLTQLRARRGSLWLPALVSSFLLLYILIGVLYLQTTSQQSPLRERISRQGSIAAGAQSRAAEVEAEFQAIQEGIPPTQLTEIDIFRAMRELASEMGLNAESLGIELKGETAQKQAASAQYRTLSFSVTVSGDYEPVSAFVQRLDQGQTRFKTLVLDQTSLVLGKTGSANMTFTIYTRPAGQ